MAKVLAEAGADIIGVSSSLESVSNVEKRLMEWEKNFTVYIDLGNRNNIYPGIVKIKSCHCVIDILVNNEGTIKRAGNFTLRCRLGFSNYNQS